MLWKKKSREEMRLPGNLEELAYLYLYMPETVLLIKIFSFWRKIVLLGNPGALAYSYWFCYYDLSLFLLLLLFIYYYVYVFFYSENEIIQYYTSRPFGSIKPKIYLRNIHLISLLLCSEYINDLVIAKYPHNLSTTTSLTYDSNKPVSKSL